MLVSPLEGLRSRSVGDVARSSAVHGLRGAEKRLQQVQESAFRFKTGESLKPGGRFEQSFSPSGRLQPNSTVWSVLQPTMRLVACLSRDPSRFSPPSTERVGVHHDGGAVEDLRRGHDLPLPGGASSSARPAQRLQRGARRRQTDVEVRLQPGFSFMERRP